LFARYVVIGMNTTKNKTISSVSFAFIDNRTTVN